ncbi:DUF4262 domain-containing protein [Geodermatophilus sabuli]|uniref:DUF4262 domain-containing protein n=1 Tax=Geodermatophilus sabuli TaxID=1564158 RepID=A0A7K3W2U2_9ACTN|nr:DUF4262 domain-containing protein [Geodermatophilus sabuli]NEK59209.1 DUF4262 domain-containing protein [Geodermatophilus sabuli]
MTTDPQTIAWLDQEDAHLATVVRECRWAVQYVGPGDETHEPAFGYTVGLFGLGHPELVVAGLGPERTHGLIGEVAAMVTAGRALVPGEPVSCDGWPGPVCVETCPNPGEVLFAANRFYRRPAEYSVPAYQLTWPHRDGSYPWDAGHPCGPACQPRPGTWRA